MPDGRNWLFGRCETLNKQAGKMGAKERVSKNACSFMRDSRRDQFRLAPQAPAKMMNADREDICCHLQPERPFTARLFVSSSRQQP
ncbi:unnamed protein product [Protopolystoma xenopodis]|uniref:Uncharacterized protein n=1 Tax=Protopolystoma xenopodis TaxID=117903 RepID=A0A3S5FCA6_9PLAT|nr:unnamed protein product [Protopolystoma xenopodis]